MVEAATRWSDESTGRTRADEARRFRPGERVADRWEIIEPIGVGSFAEVYRARDHLRGGAPLALKAIRPELTGTEAQAYLRREFHALRSFLHPWVVRTRGFDMLEDGSGLLLLDLVDGRDLGDVDPTEPFPEGTPPPASWSGPARVWRATRVVASLLDALEYVHARGWVHYDIKPRNVMVRPTGEVLLIDFHLGAREGEPIEAGLRGTAGYMAPEVITGDTDVADRRADLYGVGVLLWELLAGERIHDVHGRELLEAHALEPAPALPDDVPPALDRIARKLLAKDPDDRYPHGSAALADLAAVLGPAGMPEPGHHRDLLAPPLVGREGELARIRQILSPGDGPVARPSSDPRAIVVRGEVGSGKTRLVSEVAASWQTDGGLVLWGSASGRGQETFGPLRDALEALEHRARSLEDDARARAAARRLGEVLEHLRAPGREGRPEGEAERAALVERVADAIRLASGDRPVLVAIDDIDRADQTTLALFAFVARAGGPQRAIASARPPTTPDGSEGTEPRAWDRVIAPLVRSRRVEEVRLGRLGPEALAELCAQALGRQAVPPWLVQRIDRTADGVPAVAREALVTLAARGAIVRQRGRFVVDADRADSVRLPAGVREAVMERLAHVRREIEGTEPVLSALAIFDRPEPVGLIARLAGVSRDELAETASALRDVGLVRWTAGHGLGHPVSASAGPGSDGGEESPEGPEPELVIPHRPIRERILEDLGPAERRRLHEGAARLLEARRSRGDGPASGALLRELAEHCLRGGRREDGMAFLGQAAPAFVRDLQPLAAREAYRRLLRELGDADLEDAGRRRRAEARIRLASLHRGAGRLDDALVELGRARRVDGASLTPTLRAELQLEEGICHFRRGRLDRAEEAFRGGLQVAEGEHRADLQARLSDVLLWRGSYAEAAEAAEAAVERYEADDRENEAVLAYNTLYFSHLWRGDEERAKTYLKKSLDRSRANQAVWEAQLARAGASAAEPEGEYGDAEDAIDEGVMPFGEVGGTPLITGNLSAALVYGGKSRWEAYHRRRLALLEAIGAEDQLAYALSNLGIVETSRGDYAAARSAFQRAREIHAASQNRHGVALALQNLAELELEYGRFDEAIHLAGKAREAAEATGLRWLPGYARRIQATALLRTGDREGAEAAYAEGLRVFRDLGNRRAQDEIALDLAFLHLRADRPDEAVRLLDAIPEDRPSPPPPSVRRELARAEVELAEGESRAAVERLEEAVELADELDVGVDLRWQLHYALARARDAADRWEAALAAYVRAMEVVRDVWERSPETVRESYLADPRRRELRESFDAFKAI